MTPKSTTVMKHFVIISVILSLGFYSLYSQINRTEKYLTKEYNSDSDSLFNGKLYTIKVISSSLENNLLGDSSEREVTIYLPPGYYNAPNNKYPVVYLLHGFNCHDEFWFGEDLSWWSTGLKIDIFPVLDNLISSNIITPLIIVSPDSFNKYHGSWYKNSFVSGNWEDFIVQDLVQYIDSNYNTFSS